MEVYGWELTIPSYLSTIYRWFSTGITGFWSQDVMLRKRSVEKHIKVWCTVKSIANINNKHQCYQQFKWSIFFRNGLHKPSHFDLLLVTTSKTTGFGLQPSPLQTPVHRPCWCVSFREKSGRPSRRLWEWITIIPIQASCITPNNVLLVKIGGRELVNPIYHHLPVVFQGFLQTPLFSSTNQWEKDINDSPLVWSIGILSTAQLKIHQLPHVLRLQACLHWFSK